MERTYKFWHEGTERCEELYELYCSLDSLDMEREILATLELNWVDIELQLEKVNGEIAFTLYACIKDERGEWGSDDYVGGENIYSIISFFKSWDEVEDFLKVQLKLYCIEKGYDYHSPNFKLINKEEF